MSVSSGVNSPAPDVSTAHAATVEAAASIPATSTTASEGIIGNQTCGDKNSGG
jgi:hypothetical protein